MKTGAQKSVFDLCSKPAVCKNVQLCKISHQSPGVVTDDDWWINHVRYSVFFFQCFRGQCYSPLPSVPPQREQRDSSVPQSWHETGRKYPGLAM